MEFGKYLSGETYIYNGIDLEIEGKLPEGRS